MSLRILIISHSTNRNGAAIALLHTIKWLKNNTDWIIDIVLTEHGSMESEYERCTNRSFKYYDTNISLKLLSRIGLKKTSHFIKKLVWRIRIKSSRYDIVLANTIATNKYISLIGSNTPIVTHVRELGYTFDVFNINSESSIITRSKIFFAINSHVKQFLISNIGIDKDRIKIIPTYTPLVPKNKKLHSDIVIGSCGTVEWRKGADLFIQIAYILKKNHPELNAKFVWVGNYDNYKTKLHIEFDIDNTGLSNYVQFISETSTPDDYYSIFDVFCLTSREEALGLVAIENMKYGTPVICFERCGGIEEFADRNAAIKVPYLDLNEYSNKIYQILMDYELKTTITNNATEIIKNEFDIERIGSSIMNEISKITQS